MKGSLRTRLTIFAIVAGTIIGISLFFGDGEGVHANQSGEAVYIAGEACVINAGLDRSIGQMATEFGECLRIHQLYVTSELP
jgi:hypothetical protein